MNVKLIVVGGEATSSEIRVRLPMIIGRGKDANLTLPHPLVSRHHCELFESNGRLFVRDLGSLNGTYVDNEKIDGQRELPPGHLLTVGTVTFRAVYGGQSPDAATESPRAVEASRQSPSTAATVRVSQRDGQPAALGRTQSTDKDDTAHEADFGGGQAANTDRPRQINREAGD